MGSAAPAAARAFDQHPVRDRDDLRSTAADLLVDGHLRIARPPTAPTSPLAVATGVSYRTVEHCLPSRFNGAGVYYGRLEAAAVVGQDVFVVGGNSAGQAAVPRRRLAPRCLCASHWPKACRTTSSSRSVRARTSTSGTASVVGGAAEVARAVDVRHSSTEQSTGFRGRTTILTRRTVHPMASVRRKHAGAVITGPTQERRHACLSSRRFRRSLSAMCGDSTKRVASAAGEGAVRMTRPQIACRPTLSFDEQVGRPSQPATRYILTLAGRRLSVD